MAQHSVEPLAPAPNSHLPADGVLIGALGFSAYVPGSRAQDKQQHLRAATLVNGFNTCPISARRSVQQDC